MRTAIIGTYPPRQCGIATFTQDLYKAMVKSSAEIHSIFAMSDGSEESFPDEVAFVIDRNDVNSYKHAAHLINSYYDACIIQHEYGIFGGDTGEFILELLYKLQVPVVTNLHTVLQQPSPNEQRILQQLSMYSSKITVMTERAIHMLSDIYKVDTQLVELIPHGVPDFKYDQESAKAKLGLSDKKVMLSFGFLGRSKGFETAIDAVASVKDNDFKYIILGSTHPNIIRHEGEIYRESLMDKVKELGIEDKVEFVDTFATEELLVQYLSACDIYVTPYPNENQISSGTLSFAIGAGAAVLSTPYWYAKDLLANDRGILFDFKDSDGLATIINLLLEEPLLMARYRSNAKQYGQEMSWTNIGKRHVALLESFKKTDIKPTISFNSRNLKKNIAALFPTGNSRLSS